MEEEKKRRRKEEEIIETALVAVAGAAIIVSGLKRMLPYIDIIQWPLIKAAAPPPLLFLLLHVIIASVVIISTISHPKYLHSHSQPIHLHRNGTNKWRKKEWSIVEEILDKSDQEEEGGGGGDAEELNARAEAFIMAFRQQLRLDSSTGSRGRIREAI